MGLGLLAEIAPAHREPSPSPDSRTRSFAPSEAPQGSGSQSLRSEVSRALCRPSSRQQRSRAKPPQSPAAPASAIALAYASSMSLHPSGCKQNSCLFLFEHPDRLCPRLHGISLDSHCCKRFARVGANLLQPCRFSLRLPSCSPLVAARLLSRLLCLLGRCLGGRVLSLLPLLNASDLHSAFNPFGRQAVIVGAGSFPVGSWC